MNNSKHLRTGSDPRALPDYVALRDELMKLSHPARPDVDWKHAETLCLRLFEHNGVELQTAAWYTLARTHIAGVAGMNEGLALINTQIMYQWAIMWPVNTHARMEIIIGLNQRLQNVFRTLVLNDRDDLSLLYQAEKSLTEQGEALALHELKQASRTEVLLQQIRQAITRLENTPFSGQSEPVVVLPPQAIAEPHAENAPEMERRVFVVQPEPVVDVVVATPPAVHRRPVRPFLAGACTALFIGGLLLWGWNSLNHSSPAEQQLVASLVPLPDTLSAEQLATLRHSSSVTERQATNLVERTQQQLKWLTTLSPDWPLRYGQTQISQARALWPDDPVVVQMQKEWQQQVEVNALPLTAMNNWYEGMMKLQRLTDRLNGVDEKHGKYMTVSELKSEVFAITQVFNKNPPAEELLRQLSNMRSTNKPAVAEQMQSELKLKQLLARYSLLMQGEAPVSPQ